MTEQTGKTLIGWYNFRTNDYDYLAEPPMDYSDYIPQYQPALLLYRMYQQKGDTAQDAAIKVLKVSAGITAKEVQP